jgi:dephospho-CoA kinase
VLVVVGASGAGKSTLTRGLAALGLPGVVCHHFDTIGVPSREEMAHRFGSGEAWQAWALNEWIGRLARSADGAALAVLDAQVRPHAAVEALRRHRVTCGRVVLVDCSYAERNARLRGPRGQPELATADMDCFAAYMRGQADALGLAIIDTTGRSETECVAELRQYAEELFAH